MSPFVPFAARAPSDLYWPVGGHPPLREQMTGPGPGVDRGWAGRLGMSDWLLDLDLRGLVRNYFRDSFVICYLACHADVLIPIVLLRVAKLRSGIPPN